MSRDCLPLDLSTSIDHTRNKARTCLFCQEAAYDPDPSVSSHYPGQSTPSGPSRTTEERQPSRRFPGGAALRRPHALPRDLPPAGDAEWPLPDAWRAQHWPAHRCGPRQQPPGPLEAWRPLGRDRRAPPRGPRPPPPRPHPTQRRPPRWAWGSSSKFRRRGALRAPVFVGLARNADRSRDRYAGAHSAPLHAPIRSARSRWAWGRSFVFASGSRRRRPSRPARRPRLRLAWGSSSLFRPPGCSKVARR